jgi:hypothetical protein
VVSRRACSHAAWSRSRRESESRPKRGPSDGYGMNVTERLSVAGAQQASTRRSTAHVPDDLESAATRWPRTPRLSDEPCGLGS